MICEPFAEIQSKKKKAMTENTGKYKGKIPLCRISIYRMKRSIVLSGPSYEADSVHPSIIS